MILLIDQSKILPNKWGDRCHALVGRADFQKFVPSFTSSWGRAWYGIQVLKETVFFWGGCMGMGRHLLLGGRSLLYIPYEMREYVHEEDTWGGAT